MLSSPRPPDVSLEDPPQSPISNSKAPSLQILDTAMVENSQASSSSSLGVPLPSSCVTDVVVPSGENKVKDISMAEMVVELPTTPVVQDTVEDRSPPQAIRSTLENETFLSKLVNRLNTNREPYIEDALFQNLVTVEIPKEDYAIPEVCVAKEVIDCLSKNWVNSVIIKLLGDPVAFQVLERKIRELWRPSGRFTIMDLPNGYSIVRFELEQDFTMALTGGPWTIFGRCLMVRGWTADFNPERDKVKTVCAWVRFSNLPVVLYDERILRRIASCLGNPIKVDRNTLQATRGKYARVCIAIDLCRPLHGIIRVNGEGVRVEYEGLGVLCVGCGRQGHTIQGCLHTVSPLAEVPTPISAGIQDQLRRPGTNVGVTRMEEQDPKTGRESDKPNGYISPRMVEVPTRRWQVPQKAEKNMHKVRQDKDSQIINNRFEILGSTDEDMCKETPGLSMSHQVDYSEKVRGKRVQTKVSNAGQKSDERVEIKGKALTKLAGTGETVRTEKGTFTFQAAERVGEVGQTSVSPRPRKGKFHKNGKEAYTNKDTLEHSKGKRPRVSEDLDGKLCITPGGPKILAVGPVVFSPNLVCATSQSDGPPLELGLDEITKANPPNTTTIGEEEEMQTLLTPEGPLLTSHVEEREAKRKEEMEKQVEDGKVTRVDALLQQ